MLVMRKKMKKILSIALIGALPAFIYYCNPTDDDQSQQGQIQIDNVNKTATYEATFHSSPATNGTWHLIVNKDGSNGSNTIFSTLITPLQIYDALKELGGIDSNNISGTNVSEQSTFTKGSLIAISVTWDGAIKTYALDEFLEERIPPDAQFQQKVGIEIRFGGNRTNEDAGAPPSDNTGCLSCLYSCAAGVTSNTKANLYLLQNDSPGGDVYRFFHNQSVTISDGSAVTITMKVQ